MSKRVNLKLLSFILAIAMVSALIPVFTVPVFAEPTGTQLTGGGTLEGNYYLNSDVTLTNSITVASGKQLTIDLNGYVLKGPGNDRVITNQGTLTIKDSNSGEQTHNYAVGGDGLWTLTTAAFTVTYNELTTYPTVGAIVAVSGGAIIGGKRTSGTDDYGGGIYSSGADSKVIIESGNIIGNAANYVGGAVCVHGTGTLDIQGCIIAGNVARYGGGVSMEQIGGQNNDNLKFTMTGGEISFNTAFSDGGATFSFGIDTVSGTAIIAHNQTNGTNSPTTNRGGGGLVSANKLTVSGDAEICGNISAYGYGGGIHLLQNGSVTLGGKAKITGNKINGIENNIYLSTGKIATVSSESPLAVGAKIGITTQTVPTDAAPVAITGTDGISYSGYFSSDNKNYEVKTSAGGLELTVRTTRDVTFDSDGGSTISKECVIVGQTANEPANPTKPGFAFDGWYYTNTESVTTKWAFSTPITEDITLVAHWTATQTPVTSPADGDDYTPSYNVPVSGNKDTVKVSATIEGNTAIVNELKPAEIDKAGTGENVVVELNKLSRTVTGVKLTNKTVKNVAESDAKGLEVRLSTATVSFDANAVDGISEALEGNDIKLTVNVKFAAEQTLSAEQKTAIEDIENSLVIDAFLESNGKRISNFGGTATVTVPVPDTMSELSDIKVYYLDAQGQLTLMATTIVIVNGVKCVQFTTTHFSHYVVVETDESPAAKFVDVNPNSKLYKGIESCVAKGLMNGTSATKFSPNRSTSRGMIATILYRLEGCPEVSEACTYSDVKSTSKYADAIAWAEDNGLIDGYKNGTFKPEKAITRQQMAKILYKYAQMKGLGFKGAWMFLLDVPDRDQISSYAYEPMCWMYMHDIISGTSSGRLNPKGKATRAQVAAIIQRFCEELEK